MASRCLMPKAPCPARATFMSLTSCSSAAECSALVFENQMADGRAGGRHGIEAVDLAHVVVERPAHDQPHHHLDAFRARLAHVVEVRDLDQLLRMRPEIVEE